MLSDPCAPVGEADTFLTPVRYGVVDQVVGHAAVRPYDPPPRQVGRVVGRHDPADDPGAGPEELSEVAVCHDATRWYEPDHLEHVVCEGHRGAAPMASAIVCHVSSEAADSSTPCGSPGAYVVPSSRRGTAPSSVIMSAPAAWSQGFGRR